MNAAENRGRPRWYRFHAMFSDAFAERVISDAALPSGAILLDPWVGTGTAAAAAVATGLRSVGIDLNPVMVELARGRCISRGRALTAVESVRTLLGELRRQRARADDPLLTWFAPRAALAIRSWERVIRLAFPEGAASAEAGFLLTSLFEAATSLTAGCVSKNPTWIKEPGAGEQMEASGREISELVTRAARQRLRLCPVAEPLYQPDIRLGNSAAPGLPAGVADLVLTSPPYCTRIDYAVSTRVELAVLGYSPDALGQLRDGSMGTSTIRPALPRRSAGWGKTCADFLAAVAAHPSKSSKSYYLKTYLQYFDDLARSLAEIGRCMRPGGRVVVVVQDSYYKGLHTDLPQVLVEMGSHLGWRTVGRELFEVRSTMRRVNTRSRAYRADPTAVEAVLSFTTPA